MADHVAHGAPLFVTPQNCEHAIGVKWRWLRDHAPELGLEILTVDGKRFLRAAEVVEAIERKAKPVDEVQPEPVDELEAIRARRGKVRRVG